METLKEVIREAISMIIPSTDVEIDEIKDEVWSDLSKIYYKYEDETQKRAFREVMKEIAEKITDDRWASVYRKIYREELKDRNPSTHK